MRILAMIGCNQRAVPGPPAAEHADGAGELGVLRGDQAAFTVGTEILARVETEAAHEGVAIGVGVGVAGLKEKITP